MRHWLVVTGFLSTVAILGCSDGAPSTGPVGDGDLAGGDFDRGQTDPGYTPACFANAAFSDPPQALAPGLGEEGFWAAVRLTPPAFPFAVGHLQYVLTHGPAHGVNCDASVVHTVELYVSHDVAPPATPVPVATVVVPAVDPASLAELRSVTLTLESPVTLVEGEHLFVAVQVVGTYPDVLCLVLNAATPAANDRDYWSNATTPPFDWHPLTDYGPPANLVVTACP
jgi:hypothetical protein